MYESPVKLYMTDVQSQLIKQQEELILQAVRKVAVGVDHEELFRALRYDRDQYEKGYRDAKNEIQHCDGCRYCFDIDGEDICRRPGLNGNIVEIAVAPDGFCAWGESRNGSI